MYLLFVLLNFCLLINGLQDLPNVQLVSPQRFIEGTSLSIPCTLTAGNTTETTYTWSRNIDGWSATSSSMIILTIQRSDSALYTCTATNSAGSGSGTFALNVLYNPTVHHMTDETIEELASFSKTCPVTPGNPTQTTYSWTRSTGVGWSQTSGTMPISKLQREDTAFYTCAAENNMIPTGQPPAIGQDSNTFTLITSYRPDVLVTTTNTTESAGSAYTVRLLEYLQCIHINHGDKIG